ncbi:MAG: porin, partial [Gammaproteobacteria bacterium]|nr:porin [Gammaproteobacteria bacterium]
MVESVLVKKKWLAALSSALMTPVTMAEVAISGSIRSGIEHTGSDWQVIDNDSRLRFQFSSDLADGQNAYMNYEFRVNAAKGSMVTGDKKLLSFIGVKGDWGSLSLGAQWSTAFNTVGTFIDKSFWYGGSSLECVQYRMNHSVMFATSLGGLSLMADAQMDTSGGTLDRSTVGGLFSNGTLSVAAMYQHADDDCLGVAGGLSLGHVDLSGGFVERASGAIGWDINAAFGYLWIDYHSSDSAGAAIVMKYVLGIGNEVDLIFEGVDRESGI